MLPCAGMRLAIRMDKVHESATMGIARRAGELAAKGEKVIDLGAGEPHFPSPRTAVDAARSALEQGLTGYTAIDGQADLRAAVAAQFRRHDAPWSGEGDTLITVGAKAALFELALALFDRGDEVVLHSPCWVSLPQQVRLAGAHPVLVETTFERGFAIETEGLVSAFSDRTRAVIVNSPCNPTGGVASAESLAELARACAERGILLISDETYERFVFDGREHASVAALAARYPETVVLVGSFSKSYAMTGWRVGYVLGPREVIAAARTVQSHATSNATSFAQPGALAALLGAEHEVVRRTALLEEHRDLVIEALERLDGVRCQRPRGAFYAFIDVSGCFDRERPSATALAEELLERSRVVVVPGAAFGDDRYLRLSFAAPKSELCAGLERLGDVLAPR